MKSRKAQQYDIPIAQPPLGAGDARIRSTSYQGHTSQAYPGAGAQTPRFQSDLLDRLHRYAHTVDEKLSELGAPAKPYLPVLGRLLIISTFLEDAWRIMTNWSAQVRYIWQIRGIPWIITELFLVLNVLFMLAGSFSIVSKKHLEVGVGFLLAVLIGQAVVYGLILNLQFFARNASLTGGLLLVVSDAFANDRRGRVLPGLLRLDTKDKSQNLIFGGRLLIVVLFVAHLVLTNWSIGALLLSALSLIGCVLVVVGYKARFSASLLALLLLIQNFTTNSYWRLQSWNPQRDHVRYEYFQTLSIIGGLILLVNIGAGKISFDEKKKIY